MEAFKVLLRRPNHLNSLFQSSKSLHVMAISRGVKPAKYPSQSSLRSSLNAVNVNRLISPRIVTYSTETSSTKSSPLDETISSSAKDESEATSSESRSQSTPSTEDSDSQSTSSSDSTMTNSSSKSQTGEQLPSEVEDSTTKYDKLYKSIELEVLSYEPSVLDSYQWFVLTAASHLGIKVGKVFSPLKPEKMRFQLLKSAFVHKKHVVHYEVRTYHRFITFQKLTSSTADTFLEYIERNLPEGVGLKVTRVEAKPLPDYVKKERVQEAQLTS